MEITTRHATLQDVEMLADLAARTFYDAFASFNTPENMQAYMSVALTLSRMREELRDPCSKFLIVTVDGEPGGYAQLHKSEAPECVSGPDPVEIVRVYIEQKWLGAGVGGALMEATLDLARQLGYRTVYLGVWDQNHRAEAFYRKWGFEIVGSHIFQLGDEEQTDWWMERGL